MSLSTIGWLAWIAAFFSMEIPELLNNATGDTLSEKVWNWFAIKNAANGKARVAGQARRFVLLAFLAWLVAHFLSGGRF
jgi:hypothetical protein